MSFTCMSIYFLTFMHVSFAGKEDELYKKLSNIPHLTVYKKADIPDDMHFKHNRRIQPLLLVTDEEYSLSHNKSKIGGKAK